MNAEWKGGVAKNFIFSSGTFTFSSLPTKEDKGKKKRGTKDKMKKQENER